MSIAWVVFRENVDRRLLLGAFAILAGAALLSWQGRASLGLGAGLIAGACLCWGIDNNLTRKLSSADPVQIAMLKGLVAGAANVALALGAGGHFPAPGLILAAGLVGFLGYGVSLVLFVLALRHLGTARTGAYFSLAPFVGAVIAVAFLGEPLSAGLLVSASGCIWRRGMSTSMSTQRWCMSTATAMTNTTGMCMAKMRRRASRTRTGIGTRGWCTGTRITQTCTTGTHTSGRPDRPARSPTRR